MFRYLGSYLILKTMEENIWYIVRTWIVLLKKKLNQSLLLAYSCLSEPKIRKTTFPRSLSTLSGSTLLCGFYVTSACRFLNMGSSVSQFPGPVNIGVSPETTPSADKSAPLAAGVSTPADEKPMFNNCWSCRVLSGLGMIGAGGYVYWVAKKPVKMGYTPRPGIIAQMTIGISENWGSTCSGMGSRRSAEKPPGWGWSAA